MPTVITSALILNHCLPQEELLPPLLREHWGTDRCAPDYVQRPLAAAAKARRVFTYEPPITDEEVSR